MKRIKLAVSLVTLGTTLIFGTSSVSGSTDLAAASQGPASVDDPKAPIPPDSRPVLTNVEPKTSAQAQGEASRCGEGMLEVEGDYCPHVEQTCLRWLDPEMKLRCAEFAPESKCLAKTVRKHFCIDRFEYPNKLGEKPVIFKTWWDAKHSCEGQGKRLCGDSEWTLACEGEERLPYPYGYARNAEACNIDRPHPDANEKLIANPATRDAEVARLWQGEPSGSREACVSPYGVHDMTGNVDEWVVNESGHPYKSGLKGGYWGPVRTRCRPMTTAHYEDFAFYQVGFRCCGEVSSAANGAPAARSKDAAGKTAPVGSAVPSLPGS